MENVDLLRRFAVPGMDTKDQVTCATTLSDSFLKIAKEIDRLTPDGREKTIAMEKLEESWHWVYIALAEL